MNYIEELFARQGALLRAVSRTGSRRRAEESREGEKSPSPAAEVWELAEETAQFLNFLFRALHNVSPDFDPKKEESQE